jgi:hypothetical protein
MLVHSADQVNSGIIIRRMPGARRLTIVTRKLIPVRIEPTPPTRIAQIQ